MNLKSLSPFIEKCLNKGISSGRIFWRILKLKKVKNDVLHCKNCVGTLLASGAEVIPHSNWCKFKVSSEDIWRLWWLIDKLRLEKDEGL